MEIERFRVAADRNKGWWFCAVWALISTPLVTALVGLAVAIDEIEAADFLLIWAGAVAVMAVYGLSFNLLWQFTSARTEYEVDDAYLIVRRRGVVHMAIPRESVVDFEMVGTMDVRHCLTDVAPPPAWPNGHVWFGEGHAKRHAELPEIMMWGSRERARVEAGMRRALGLRQRPALPTIQD